METLRLKERLPVEDDVENWDDDDFLVEGDNLTFRSASTTSTANHASSRRRDSNSSHFSFQSDMDSSFHGGEEQHIHLPQDDGKSTIDAITIAQNAGIPLPSNLDPSALMGGTIKRLGGRKIRKIIQGDDWEADLELPNVSQGLQLKSQEQSDFPDSLRQVSAGSSQASPTKATRTQMGTVSQGATDSKQFGSSSSSALSNLDKFRDVDDDDDDIFGGGDTIKVSRSRQPPKAISLITPPTPQKAENANVPDDDLENDFQLPSDGKLKLSTRREIPKTPSSNVDDLDWGEGSLGTRFGGTRRDGRSNRSSSTSALSPSVSSSFTAESEDETFDGLVLPSGSFNFQERLKQGRKSNTTEPVIEESPVPARKSQAAEADRPDFLDDLDFGDDNVFDAGKLTLHRNVKIKESRTDSPARPKTAVSLTFTNKSSASTRIPRLSHERAHSTSLEPVSESGGPILQSRRRPLSRMGHSAQSSVTSIPTPTPPSPGQAGPPSTPRRREIGNKNSLSSLRHEPTTTSAQLLKQKRSMPVIRATPKSPAKALSFRPERPPSRSESSRPQSGLRPKTPVDRRLGPTDSPATVIGRKTNLPFLPAGAASSHSHHVTSKNVRHFRRHDSDNSIDMRPHSRAVSRTTMRSPSPQRYRVNADTWERLSKPKHKKNFGDGHELDDFDDLPTSKETETRFLRQPIWSGPKVALRNKVYQHVLPDGLSTPTPSTPPSTLRNPGTPHFARDTAASRRARETSLAQKPPTTGPLAAVTAQRAAPSSAARNSLTSFPHQPLSTIRLNKKTKRPPQLKPHLISNLNTGKESKVMNGMIYNPDTFRWEGNENALNVFDAPLSTPTPASTSMYLREKETTTPRPALITNITATKGVQVVGGMVFDPQNMCWLKLDSASKTKSETSDPLGGIASLDDDEDVFKDIPDLDDKTADKDTGKGRVSDIKDEWLVGEEFDVGPEFVRRQREEEERWRKKCESWVGRGLRDREAWRWTIRELVSQFDDLPM